MSIIGTIAAMAGASVLDNVLGSTMDSLGISPHGRDQYVSMQNQRELLALQNQYNNQMFDKQFSAENTEFDRRYNQYQSPSAMVRQYNEAGLNSAALLQNGSGGFGSIGSAVNPSPVSVPQSSASSPMSANSSQSKTTDYIDALSRMKLTDAQSAEVYELLQARLSQIEAETKWKNALTFQQQMESELYKKYGDAERGQQVANLVQQGLLLAMQGKESEANAEFLKAKEMLAQDEHKFNDVKFPRYGLYLDALIQNVRSETSENKASSYRSYKEGKLFGEQAETEKKLRGFRWTIMASEANIAEDTYEAKINEILNNSIASQYLPESAKTALELAKKENNIYYAKQVLNAISEGVGLAIQARTGGRIASAMETRNLIEQKMQESNLLNNVKEKVVNRFDKNGRIKEREHTYQRNRPSRK